MAISTSGVNVPTIGNLSADTSWLQSMPKNQMSIKDMVGLAKDKLELNKARETYESDVAGKKAQNQRLQTEAAKAGLDFNQQQANIARSVYGGFLSDPDFINGNKEQMTAKMNSAQDFLGKLGVNHAGVNQIHDDVVSKIQDNPKDAYQMIKNGVQVGGGNANQFQAIQGAQNTPVYNGGENNQGGQGSAQPNQPAQPNQTVQTSGQQTQPAANLPEYSQPVKLQYPVRQAGVAYAAAPSEVADKDAGTIFRNNLVQGQSNLTTSRNNLDAVIQQANKIESEAGWLPETGIIGATKRGYANLIGDPKYQQMSKDLANVQLSNMKALGTHNTDAGLSAQQAASGTITYPPSVIKDIAERTRADITNIDMQATAAQKFANQFGDNNMKTFQQEWAKNADTKVFQVINIAKDQNLSQAQKQAKRDELFKGMSPEKLQEFNTKYQNIRKLEQTGRL
jgi:hypothetical protein